MDLVDQILRKSFSTIKRLLLANKRVSNAIMDVYNMDEFTNLYEHEKMLADRIRVDTYRKGIERNIRPGDVVVDLGTGSGILAFYAADSGAKKVYAIDHSEFIEVARVLAAKKGEKKIRFEQVNSRSFNPPEKVDVILHEQIGDDLFDENMIRNILDLKSRILKKGGRVIPGRFELYLEPITLKSDYAVPPFWENRLCGIDYGFLKESPLIRKYQKMEYRFRYLEAESADYFLCEPEPVLTIDLNEWQSEQPVAIPRQVRNVTREGVMDGICLWFRVEFDAETSFDTSPLNGSRSWSNRLFRTERIHYQAGEQIVFDVEMVSPLIANTWKIHLQQAESLLRGVDNPELIME